MNREGAENAILLRALRLQPNAVNNAACQVTVHIIDAVLLPIAFGAPLPPALPKSGAATFFSLMPTAVIGAALLLVAGFF